MVNDILYTIALTQMNGIGPATARRMCSQAGNATVVMENHRNLRDVIPDASDPLVALMADTKEAIEKAERELEFMEGKRVKCLTYQNSNYPQRLLECDDAPLALYFCGEADLNASKVISMVCTRRCTTYGKDMCRRLVEEMKELMPDVLIVSGLAYGIDVCCHRESLKMGLPTVGVLAHGLDTLYPRIHRATAVEMVKNGGLLTEYPSQTKMDKGLFVQRNRIVAGMCDATIVVESAEKGGSLITANLAHGYEREVLAVPGRVTDEMSKGCNRIIQNDMAHSIRNAEDIARLMGWNTEVKKEAKQGELFVQLTAEQQKVIDSMRGQEPMTTNQIMATTGQAFSEVSVVLFELENMRLVEFAGGGRYVLKG